MSRSRADLPEGFFFPVITKEWLYRLWEKIEGNPWIFSSEGGEKRFLQHFLNQSELTIEGPGIVITVNNVIKEKRTSLHGFVFSKEVYGYLGELQEVGLWLLDKLPVNRIEIRVPKGFKGLKRLLKEIGFKEEGTLRNDYLNGTMGGDNIMMSLIREDCNERR